MWYSVAADLVVALHLAYIGYVVVGQLVIWIGAAAKRQFVRNFWFRLSHLAAIAFVAYEAAVKMVCPMTIWERQLRELAGEMTRGGSFTSRLFHDLIFLDLPEWAFDYLHIGFAVLVLGTFLLLPPRLPDFIRRRVATQPATPLVKE
jgi:hypothetical protein